MNETKIQRTYKDTLFRMIFRDKKALLSLYNALNHSDYQNEEDLKINTLENVLYMGMKNDISFLIAESLNLYEAQSSWNPNMPLRDLLYLAELYKGYVEENRLDVYSTTRLSLPTPQCIVFYNGTKEMEDVKQIRLSEAFGDLRGQEPTLECVVTYLNMNYGHNKEIMAQCRMLQEYALLVQQIRVGLSQGKQLAAAVDQAVEYCIEHDILADFLRKHRAEVTQVILTEYNEERHIKNEKENSYKEGYEDGEEIGQKRGEEIGQKRGRIFGIIEIYRRMDWTDDDICRELLKEQELTEQEIREYLEMK